MEAQPAQDLRPPLNIERATEKHYLFCIKDL